jgi:hypothetical protein
LSSCAWFRCIGSQPSSDGCLSLSMDSCCGLHHFRELIFVAVQFRLFCFAIGFQRRIISRINLGIGSFRLQQKNLTVRNQPCVGSGQSDFLCCGHRMDLGLSGKRIWQFELHTQQFVILWYQNRAWRFAYMCLGAIVFGQSIQASSMLLPCHDSDSLGWTGFG